MAVNHNIDKVLKKKKLFYCTESRLQISKRLHTISVTDGLKNQRYSVTDGPKVSKGIAVHFFPCGSRTTRGR